MSNIENRTAQIIAAGLIGALSRPDARVILAALQNGGEDQVKTAAAVIAGLGLITLAGMGLFIRKHRPPSDLDRYMRKVNWRAGLRGKRRDESSKPGLVGIIKHTVSSGAGVHIMKETTIEPKQVESGEPQPSSEPTLGDITAQIQQILPKMIQLEFLIGRQTPEIKNPHYIGRQLYDDRCRELDELKSQMGFLRYDFLRLKGIDRDLEEMIRAAQAEFKDNPPPMFRALMK